MRAFWPRVTWVVHPLFRPNFGAPFLGSVWGVIWAWFGTLGGAFQMVFWARLGTFGIAFQVQLEAFGQTFEFFQFAVRVPLAFCRTLFEQCLPLALDSARASPCVSERIRPFVTERAPLSGPIRKPPLADPFWWVIWAGWGHSGPFECSWGCREHVLMLSWCPLPVSRTIVSATCIGS